MKKRTKIIIAIAAIVVIGAAVVGGIYLANVNAYKDAVVNMAYADVDISSVPDGSYTGECHVGFIYAKVEVTVKDGAIVQIDLLEHKNERGKDADSIIDDIVAQQKVDVDEISGATNSSKVIKKAADNALANAAGGQ
jgi:uncharacterized protein with FMN-binding domain